MEVTAPQVVVLAGPNGAGKTTAAAMLLKGVFHVEEFVNADTIAQGLSAFAQETVAWQAGRIMLARLRELADARKNFAFETTLAGRAHAPLLRGLKGLGYQVQLVFLWLPSAEMAVERVADRVRRGGHAIPQETIRRRYTAGLANLVDLYLPLADTWEVIDNKHWREQKVIAAGGTLLVTEVIQPNIWASIQRHGDSK